MMITCVRTMVVEVEKNGEIPEIFGSHCLQNLMLERMSEITPWAVLYNWIDGDTICKDHRKTMFGVG